MRAKGLFQMYFSRTFAKEFPKYYCTLIGTSESDWLISRLVQSDWLISCLRCTGKYTRTPINNCRTGEEVMNAGMARSNQPSLVVAATQAL